MTKPIESLDGYEEITDVTFDHEGAHLAICHSLQRSANQYTHALITKAEDSEDEELIKALEQISVSMSFEDFLDKFMGVYGDTNKEILCRMFGFETKREYHERMNNDEEEAIVADDSYNKYLDENLEDKMSTLSIIKEQAELDTPTHAALSTEDKIAVLEFQEAFEKAMASYKESNVDGVEGVSVDKEDALASVNKDGKESPSPLEKEASESNDEGDTINKQNLKEDYMSKQDKEQVEKSADAIALEKAQERLDVLEKAMQEKEEALEKAMVRMEAFEKAEVERIEKGFKGFADSLSFAEDKEAVVDVLMKSRDDEAVLDTIVSLLKAAQEKVSSLVELEIGVEGVDDVKVEKSANARLEEKIAAQFADNKYL